jgi:hypothetical protein
VFAPATTTDVEAEALWPPASVTVAVAVSTDQAVAVRTVWFRVAATMVHTRAGTDVTATIPPSIMMESVPVPVFPVESVTVLVTVIGTRSASVWFTVSVINSPGA